MDYPTNLVELAEDAKKNILFMVGLIANSSSFLSLFQHAIIFLGNCVFLIIAPTPPVISRRSQFPETNTKRNKNSAAAAECSSLGKRRVSRLLFVLLF